MTTHIELTDVQHRSLYEHLRSTLAPQRVREHPDVQPLVQVLRKLQQTAGDAFCRDCGKRKMHARGLCMTCYQREIREQKKSAKSA